jgi:hypothetical protein
VGGRWRASCKAGALLARADRRGASERHPRRASRAPTQKEILLCVYCRVHEKYSASE